MEKTMRRGLSGAALKWIAALTMLIDHIGLVLVWRGWILPAGLYRETAYVTLYTLLRVVGRFAFPIFCFLLTEGFRHTRSRARYLLRLLLFALLSELPYDLAFSGAVLEFGDQNVFFTLALGLLCIWSCEALTGEGFSRLTPLRGAAACAAAAACMAAAELLRSDYGFCGVLLIFAFWALRERPLARDLCAALVACALWRIEGAWWIEVFGVLALPLVHLYSGERGKQSRLFFYVFYPAHLLILAFLSRILFPG